VGSIAKNKILVVDDELDFLEMLGQRIRFWGYELIEASSGIEAVEALKGKGPDIIILDYMMPQMDGIDTLKEIRNINKDIPVIMFTAYPEAKAMKSAERLGVSSFIPKLSAYSNSDANLKTAIDMVEKKMYGKG
jgi:two-component system response regulator MprA